MLAPAFARLPHPNPTADEVRAAAIADPVFGRVFTDHMVSIRYSDAKGWHDAQVMPRGPLLLDPATAVLGTEVAERAIGTAAAKKQLGDWSKLALALDGKETRFTALDQQNFGKQLDSFRPAV